MLFSFVMEFTTVRIAWMKVSVWMLHVQPIDLLSVILASVFILQLGVMGTMTATMADELRRCVLVSTAALPMRVRITITGSAIITVTVWTEATK